MKFKAKEKGDLIVLTASEFGFKAKQLGIAGGFGRQTGTGLEIGAIQDSIPRCPHSTF